ncbi:AAA family ATPase [Aneurinibacillus aneurinilyticus]|uniref:AAA family ATPase n=1 Tax=Aneurinibacillus aneurinilyticus TaxID=1391 RepID=A0A848D1T4_ANEAE|nr:AAA family ATPase [Aneurinibacillus aneurinilyticus]NMF00048.1 AAA family ATPase [Aneurinibacillus aneurinilyticus]
MSAYGEMILSRVVDEGTVEPLVKYGITADDMPTQAEKDALAFIVKYAEHNGGKAPSYAELAQNTEVTYIPQVSDSYDYLVRQLKANAARLQALKMLQEEAPKKFSELDGNAFLDWLTDESIRIKMGTQVRKNVGVSVVNDTNRFLEEYERRKAGESFRIWKSKFPTINREIGGYFSGNMYTWYGRSGRGKSVFTLEEAIESAFQSATVLIWAMEMSEFEIYARAYSSISARSDVGITATIDGVDYAAGFENRALLTAQLDEAYMGGFKAFLAKINEIVPGNIIVRAADHEDFEDRSVRALEADILATKADVVVVDPFYYLDYDANTSRTAGGDAAATSKKLRKLAGRTKTVIHVITQADEVRDDKGEDGERELRPPSRAEIKKTKAVLEDAAAVFGIDTVARDGLGVIYAGKGRAGGEDATAEILYLPSYGIVREMETGEAAAAQFESVF